MKKKIDWKYLLVGVVCGVFIYGMGLVPASIVAMFQKNVNVKGSGK